jgi:hypothetical protein
MRKISISIAVLAAALAAPSAASADDLTWNIASSVKAGDTLTGSLTNTTTVPVADFVLVPARGTAAVETSIKTQVTYNPSTGDIRWTVPATTGTGKYRLRAVQNMAVSLFKDVTVEVLSASTPTLGIPTQPTTPAAPATPAQPETQTPQAAPSIDGGIPQSNGNLAKACKAKSLVVDWKVGKYEGRALVKRNNVVRAPKGARVVFRVKVTGENCANAVITTVGGFRGDLVADRGRATGAAYIAERSKTLAISAGGKTVKLVLKRR